LENKNNAAHSMIIKDPVLGLGYVETPLAGLLRAKYAVVGFYINEQKISRCVQTGIIIRGFCCSVAERLSINLYSS
jgi:UDP-N-acetyl-D-mannosaminuronate dehydrogenase